MSISDDYRPIVCALPNCPRPACYPVMRSPGGERVLICPAHMEAIAEEMKRKRQTGGLNEHLR